LLWQSTEGHRAALEANDELRALHGLATQVQRQRGEDAQCSQREEEAHAHAHADADRTSSPVASAG